MSRTRKGRPIDGWLVIDKPLGLTSAQVVGRLKRATGAAKLGHAGTLDPLASGVLPIAFGEATKTMGFAMDGRKAYRVTIAWGEARDTDDAEGAVIARSDVRPDAAALCAALPRFTGRILQTPPRFSAIKVAGRRAYDLARAGEAVTLAPRLVEIDSVTLLSQETDTATLEIACGKGTYIRSLARDLAEALGTCGHVRTLRRTRVGPFNEAQSISLDSVIEEAQCARHLKRMLPIMTALDDIPAVAVSEREADFIRSGRTVALPDSGAIRAVCDDGVIVVVAAGQPVAIARIDAGMVRPMRVFNPSTTEEHDVDHG